MANPFLTTVGLKGHTTTEPTIWLNDLPGMSTELVSSVSRTEDYSEDDADGTDTMLTRVHRLSYEKLSSMIQGELSKSADFMFLASKTVEPTQLTQKPDFFPASANLVGSFVEVPYSPYSELAVLSFTCFSLMPTAVDTTIKIYDVVTGNLVNSTPVTAQPGYNEFTVSQVSTLRIGGYKWFVGIDATGLILQQLGYNKGWTTEGFSWSHSIPIAAEKLESNLASSSLYGYVSAIVRCSLDKLINNYVDQLQWCYAFIVAHALMTEKLASVNVNVFTNTNRMFTEELETRLMDEAKKRLTPVTRTMIKDLRPTPVLQSDSEFQSGYFQGGYV